MSTTEGLQVPVTAFVDVLGNVGTLPFAQIINEDPKLNVGVIFGLITTVNVTGIAQNPASGVKI